MKNVLLSVRPKWCEKILSGEKTIEVRKSAQKEVPFKAYIYQTKSKDNAIYKRYKVDDLRGGKVIGEFICDKIYLIKNHGSGFSVAHEEQGVTNEIARQSCLAYYDMVRYLGNKDGYGWHISDLKIYDKPRELSEFNRPCVSLTRNCEDCIKGKTPYTWDFDEDKGTIFCTRKIKRPPQSWCYVEESEKND